MDGRERTIPKASVSRRYQDRDGNWKSSQSFTRNEIPLAVYCLMKAFGAMLDRQEDDVGLGAVEELKVE